MFVTFMSKTLPDIYVKNLPREHDLGMHGQCRAGLISGTGQKEAGAAKGISHCRRVKGGVTELK